MLHPQSTIHDPLRVPLCDLRVSAFRFYRPSTIHNRLACEPTPFRSLMGFSPDHRGAAGAQRWPRNSFEKVGKTSGRDQRPCWSQIPVSDTSHEPNSYRDFTPRHGGLVGGPRPSRPTFIHNSGGLRLLFPLREKSLVFRHGSVQCDTVAFLWQCNQRRSQAERSGTGGAAGDGQRQSAATIPMFSSMNLPHPHFRNTYEPQNS